MKVAVYDGFHLFPPQKHRDADQGETKRTRQEYEEKEGEETDMEYPRRKA